MCGRIGKTTMAMLEAACAFEGYAIPQAHQWLRAVRRGPECGVLTAMPSIQCFMLEETSFVERWLRRYSSVHNGTPERCKLAECPAGMGYHNASVFLDRIEMAIGEQIVISGTDVAQDHPVWPKTCEACPYAFDELDQWQVFKYRVWRVSVGTEQHPVGEEHRMHYSMLPPGAMWWSQTMDGSRHLCVKTPGGEWDIDAPSVNEDGTRGQGWRRTGEAPRVTVDPSIRTGRPGKPDTYHGKLIDGWLHDA